ncbi:LysR family transcriptional regulator [Variovorax jilinensis]|uniref:LysR family transcriptional regulator n=1 Tax=Variovorax jilinensis TaxID=3053513 RepID=UPI0025749D31|nr:LysR family transcriptional regulator [Variovorax sp. J22P168]
MDQPKSSRSVGRDAMTTAFHLNLRHLRGLIAVHEHGSISAAAIALSISQPALTQGILKLEGQLGEVLFERRSDGIDPTPAGRLVLERATASMQHLTAGSRLIAGTTFEPDRRLTMTQLRAFLGLFKAGSFTATATDLGLSQAAVHRAVRELEEALGKRLVERRGRGVHMSFGGRRFARSCWLAVKELQAALSELGLDPHSPTISIGTTPLARAFLVPEAMSMMVAERFPASFRVLEGNWGELVESLRDGVIDLIVGELPVEGISDLRSMPLYTEAPIIVAGHQHALVGRDNPGNATLGEYPWIIAPETSPLRAEWERLFPIDRPQVPVECGSIMIIGRLLTSSDMLTLAMPDQVALQIRSGLLARIGEPLAGSMPTIGTTMRQSWRPTSGQSRFLELLREASAGLGATASRKPLIEAPWI